MSEERSSKVEVLADAIKGLSDPEMVRLRQLVEALRRDRVEAMFDAICSMKVDDLVRLQAMLNSLLRARVDPPAVEPGHGAGDRQPVAPDGPNLADSATKKLEEGA